MTIERSVPIVNEQFVLTNCRYFVNTQVWPLQQRLDPVGWLSNFAGNERVHAAQLLHSFMYFSSHILDKLFVSAFRNLSRVVTTPNTPLSQRKRQWSAFLNSVIVTFPSGETPSVADSGHLFARRARDLIGIPENRLKPPDKALEAILHDNAKTIVFVDDFVGSGQQMQTTWFRELEDTGLSFADVDLSRTKLYYIPLFCTSFARLGKLQQIGNGLTVIPCHVLTSDYGILNENSIHWPKQMSVSGRQFVYDASMRLGLPDTSGNSSADWQGFCQLGLGMAFEHQIPDASLPLFYTTQNGWKPLWRNPT